MKLNNRMRLFLALPAGLACLIFGAVSLAWACTPTTPIRNLTLSPPTGRSGAEVTASGSFTQQTSVPIEIRWNGVSGPVVATIPNPGAEFSAKVAIPNVAPGVYTLVSVVSDSGVSRTVFEVTAPSEATGRAAAGQQDASSSLWAGFAPGHALNNAGPSGAITGPADSGSSMAMGAGLAGLGILAFGAAATVAVAGRRRRASAGA